MARTGLSKGTEAAPNAGNPGEASRGRRGRPRDADVDLRIATAARAVYAERGWSGFNFDVVAKTASVSKDAIYRRYDSKEQLLSEAIKIPAQPIDVTPGSDLRAQLVDLASQTLHVWSGSDGLLLFRLFVESNLIPTLGEVFRSQALPHVTHYRRIVTTAIDSGTLTAIQHPTAFLDGLVGGIIMHILATPPHLKDRMLANSDTFVREHVDLMLAGAGYSPTAR